MTRRHTLIWTATTGTTCLWGATIVLAVTDAGSDRLHVTVLAGSFLAALVTMGLIGLVAFRAFAARAVALVADELHNGVAQAADELHEAVDEMGKTLRLDRATIVAVRVLLAELKDMKLPQLSRRRILDGGPTRRPAP